MHFITSLPEIVIETHVPYNIILNSHCSKTPLNCLKLQHIGIVPIYMSYVLSVQILLFVSIFNTSDLDIVVIFVDIQSVIVKTNL